MSTGWKRTWRMLVLVGLAGLAGGQSLAAQETEVPADDPLAFFEPFMGPWVPHSDWEALQADPALAALVPLNFEWTPSKGAIRFCEGMPNRGEHDACGLVVWNGTTARAEFLAYQEQNALVFDGYYEMTAADTMRRIYDVIEVDGVSRKYRETFKLLRPDLLDWRTDRLDDGVWVPRRPDGVEFHAVRAPAQPTDRLRALERFIGDWHPDESRIPERMRQWREQNNVTDGYSSFAWGTDRRWIEFGDHRRIGSEWLHEGAGLIAWNPGRQRLTYVEHTSSETSLEGTVVQVDDLVFERHYTVFSVAGVAQRWKDTWRWDDPGAGCFEWTTTRVDGNEESAWPPYWVCKR